MQSLLTYFIHIICVPICMYSILNEKSMWSCRYIVVGYTYSSLWSSFPPPWGRLHTGMSAYETRSPSCVLSMTPTACAVHPSHPFPLWGDNAQACSYNMTWPIQWYCRVSLLRCWKLHTVHKGLREWNICCQLLLIESATHTYIPAQDEFSSYAWPIAAILVLNHCRWSTCMCHIS